MAKPNGHVLSFPHSYGPPPSPLKTEIPIVSVSQLAPPQERRVVLPPAEAIRQRPQSPSFLLSSKKVVFSERLSPEPKVASPSLLDAKFGSHTGNVVIQDALAVGSMKDWWHSLMAKSGRTMTDNTIARPNFDAWFRQCVLCTDMEKPLAWAKATCARVVGGLDNAVFHTTCTIENFAECLHLLAESQLVADAFKGTDIVMSHFVVSLRRMTEVDQSFQTKSVISMPWWNKVKSAPYLPPSSSPWNNVQPSRSSYFDASNSTSFALSTEWSVKSISDNSGKTLQKKGDNSFIPPTHMLFKNVDSEKSLDDLDFSDTGAPGSVSKPRMPAEVTSPGQGNSELRNSIRPGSAPSSRSLHVGLPGSGTVGNQSSPYSRSNSQLMAKPIFEMGGTKMQTPAGRVTSRRFAADSLMKSYKENTASLVAHSSLRQSSHSENAEGEAGEQNREKSEKSQFSRLKVATSRPQSARPAPKEGELTFA